MVPDWYQINTRLVPDCYQIGTKSGTRLVPNLVPDWYQIWYQIGTNLVPNLVPGSGYWKSNKIKHVKLNQIGSGTVSDSLEVGGKGGFT